MKTCTTVASAATAADPVRTALMANVGVLAIRPIQGHSPLSISKQIPTTAGRSVMCAPVAKMQNPGAIREHATYTAMITSATVAPQKKQTASLWLMTRTTAAVAAKNADPVSTAIKLAAQT
jgi:hypothetical protein